MLQIFNTIQGCFTASESKCISFSCPQTHGRSGNHLCIQGHRQGLFHAVHSFGPKPTLGATLPCSAIASCSYRMRTHLNCPQHQDFAPCCCKPLSLSSTSKKKAEKQVFLKTSSYDITSVIGICHNFLSMLAVLSTQGSHGNF